ncbi:MAG: NUDIX hydrolase [Geodermatophilaceae bacterium]|nr:NUDIX hydrolase [Geodermatophilaceae bacterium]
MTPLAAPSAAAPLRGYAVESSEEIYGGKIFSLRKDSVRMLDGQVAVRETVAHPGAAVVVALDEQERVVLIRQYRHPVRDYLWELPAGLLDVQGEAAHRSAARELAEEAGLIARRWDTLLDLRSSPGFSDEAVRVYLARDLSDVAAADRYVGEHEESDLTIRRVDLDEAARWVLAGRIENAAAAAGVLAALAARAAGYSGLRAVDAPWPAKPTHAS